MDSVRCQDSAPEAYTQTSPEAPAEETHEAPAPRQNRRSGDQIGGHIAGAAVGLLGHSHARAAGKLRIGGQMGSKVLVAGHMDADAEAAWVGNEIIALQQRGVQPGEVAVLVRSAAQTRAFETCFRASGLPYRVVGAQHFYERPEVCDALAYLRLLLQPDDSSALERIINTPKRGIGRAVVRTICDTATQQKLPLLEAARRLAETSDLKAPVRMAVLGLVADIKRWRGLIRSLLPLDLTRFVLEESGYTRMWDMSTSTEGWERRANLKELINAIAAFPTLADFIVHVTLMTASAPAAPGDNGDGDGRDGGDAGDGGEGVSLMTIDADRTHAGNSRKFTVVFLAGWEETLFPSPRALEDQDGNGLEAERQLAYAGLTRARQHAYITHAGRRRQDGYWTTCQPSRFLRELPPAHIEVRDEEPAPDTNPLALYRKRI